MIDINKMRRRLDAAVERFVQGALAVAIELYADARARQPAPAPAPAPPARPKKPARKPVKVARRTRGSGPIYRAPLVPIASEEVAPRPVRQKPKGPSPERIAAGVLKLTGPSPTGFTFEQIAGSIRVAPEVLQPVLDQLVADQKVRVVTEGDLTTYRRPRIEPIRRRRDEPQET
jgi:hypothetical protein